MELKPSLFIPKSHREFVDRQYTERTTLNYVTAASHLQTALNLSDDQLKHYHDHSIFLNDLDYDRLARAQIIENFHPKTRRQMFLDEMRTGLAANLLFNSDKQKQAALKMLASIDPAVAESLHGLPNSNKLVIFHLSDLVKPDPIRLATYMAHEHYHFDSRTQPSPNWDALDTRTLAKLKVENPEISPAEITRMSDGFRTHFSDGSAVIQLSGYHTDDALAMVTHAKAAAQMQGHSFEAHLEALYDAAFVQANLKNNVMALRQPLLIDTMVQTFGANLDIAAQVAKYGDRQAVYDLAQPGFLPVEEVVDLVESGNLKTLEASLFSRRKEL